MAASLQHLSAYIDHWMETLRGWMSQELCYDSVPRIYYCLCLQQDSEGVEFFVDEVLLGDARFQEMIDCNSILRAHIRARLLAARSYSSS